jgi:hypothetical protein
VKTAAKSVGQDFAYAHPTVKSMAEALTGGAKPEDPEKRKKDVMAVLEEHTKGLKDLKVSKRERPEKLTIVLTGSTGHLGTHILECLLSEDKVAHVYAFNRPSKAGSSLERHEKALSNGYGSSVHVWDTADGECAVGSTRSWRSTPSSRSSRATRTRRTWASQRRSTPRLAISCVQTRQLAHMHCTALEVG